MSPIALEKENKQITKEYKELLRISYQTLTDEDKKLLKILARTYEANLALKNKSDAIRLWRVLRSEGTLRDKLARLKAIYAN